MKWSELEEGGVGLGGGWKGMVLGGGGWKWRWMGGDGGGCKWLKLGEGHAAEWQ